MAKARRPSKSKQAESSRPSIFFIIALIVGFGILVWWFIHFLPDRSTGEEDDKNAAVVAPCRSLVFPHNPTSLPVGERGLKGAAISFSPRGETGLKDAAI